MFKNTNAMLDPVIKPRQFILQCSRMKFQKKSNLNRILTQAYHSDYVVATNPTMIA
jgi:hypothetical protein